MRRELGAGIVVAFLCLFVLQNSLCGALDQAPEGADGHYARSVGFHLFLRSGDATCLRRYGEPVFMEAFPSPEAYPLLNPYPPLSYAVTSLFYTLGGISPVTARHSMAFFGVVLLLSLFGIGRRYGGLSAGLAVMAFGAGSGFLLRAARAYQLDLPQAALSTLALYLLLKSDAYQKRRYSLLFGVVLGLSLLAKWSTLFFIALPALLLLLPAIVRSLRSALSSGVLAALGLWMVWGFSRSLQEAADPQVWMGQQVWLLRCLQLAVLPALGAVAAVLLVERSGMDGRWRFETWRPLFNFALAVAVTALIAAPWYYFVCGDLAHNLTGSSSHAHLLSLPDTLRLLAWLFHRSSNFSWALLLGGLLSLALVRDKRLERIVIAISTLAAAAFIVQTGSPGHFFDGNMQARLLVPVVALAAVLGGSWVGYLGRAGAGVAALLVCAALYTGLSWAGLPGQERLLPPEREAATLGSYLGLWSTRSPATEERPPRGSVRFLAERERPAGAGERLLNTVVFHSGQYQLFTEVGFAQVLLGSGRRTVAHRFHTDVPDGGAAEVVSKLEPLAQQADEVLVFKAPLGMANALAGLLPPGYALREELVGSADAVLVIEKGAAP